MNFFTDYFFFTIDKNEKDTIRHKIMESDHSIYMMVLKVIALFQIVMLVFNIFKYGITTDKYYAIGYRALYLSLLFLLAISNRLAEYFYKKKQPLPYFVVVSLLMTNTMLWSVGVSIFDSYPNYDLTVFSYTVVAISGFIILEPWVSVTNVCISTIALNVLMAFLPTTRDFYGSGVIINSLSVFALSIIACCFNFYRRINSVRLELEVSSLNETLNKKAYVDDLTGLYNRRYLTENIEKPLNVGNLPSGIMLFDIDHFKNVNDRYGHQNGDIVLKELGRIVQEFTTKYANYAIRYGGEEFLIYFDTIKQDELYILAEKLREDVSNTNIVFNDGTRNKITISIGIASANRNTNYPRLINVADDCLYEAKNRGRNMVCRENIPDELQENR